MKGGEEVKGTIDVEIVGKRMKDARVNAGYRQADVAELMGVSRQTINYYENDPGRVNVKILFELAEMYGCSVSYFFAN